MTLRERYCRRCTSCCRERATRTCERFLVTREHAATFRAAPGVARAAPRRRAPSVAGLVLAGAWTDTGWPATLEGAVLSGHAAARGPRAPVLPDRPAGVDPRTLVGAGR